MTFPTHKAPAADGPWNGAAMRAKVRSGESMSYYGALFAWCDDGRDASPESCRYLHHSLSEDGAPGEASAWACRRGIVALNGAFGPVAVRGRDREAVYAHLAAHLADAGLAPPRLRDEDSARALVRSVGGRDVEVRHGGAAAAFEARADLPPALSGYAAVYDSPSADFGGWTEVVARGAFDRSLADSASRPVKALWNHNSDWVLGSTEAGTLRLASDATGLLATITPPHNAFADAFVEAVRRGDVRQMSFGFIVRGQSWRETDGGLVRALNDVELWEVSPVAFPAYLATSISAGAESASRAGLLSRRLRLLEVES